MIFRKSDKNGVNHMSEETRELKEIYGKIKRMSIDDIHEALKTAETEEERELYLNMTSFIMQMEQKKILKRKEKVHG
ncbi:hypothetical protein EXV96_15685 (plasmid) [Enterococcus faecium]|uniref:Uncharacterized protein n=4 Tax=Enterococcus TaxID=1350 RepID=G9M860_ENTFC|nr:MULTISPECIES: hypothetical protein [Enterococcus]QBF50972.1 hypothetical protein EXV96_15685 [Enterococcus faecium]BAL40955.1 hypothetical protein [Enterococcus faecium]